MSPTRLLIKTKGKIRLVKKTERYFCYTLLPPPCFRGGGEKVRTLLPQLPNRDCAIRYPINLQREKIPTVILTIFSDTLQNKQHGKQHRILHSVVPPPRLHHTPSSMVLLLVVVCSHRIRESLPLHQGLCRFP